MFKCIPRFRPSLDWVSLGIILKEIFFNHTVEDKEKKIDFEKVFADYIGVHNAITVPSGRMGIYLILKNLGLKETAEVILSSFTYWAVPAVVRLINLRPVFVDIDPENCNLNVTLIEKKITKDTKVIIPTHLYGLPCNMNVVMEVAKRHNLFVIEDCVQATGAEYGNKRVGSIGDAAYFSFGITKNIALLGGGMVVTNDDRLAEGIRKETSDYGFLNKGQILKKAVEAAAMKIFTSPFIYSFFLFPLIYLSNLLQRDIIDTIFYEKESLSPELLSLYFKLVPPGIQYKVGSRIIVQNYKLNDKRVYNGTYFLKHIRTQGKMSLPSFFDKNVFTSFPIRIKKRQLVVNELLKLGIDTSRGYMKAFGEDCPNAKMLEREILHIPIYPSLKESDLGYICEVINGICKRTDL